MSNGSSVYNFCTHSLSFVFSVSAAVVAINCRLEITGQHTKDK